MKKDLRIDNFLYVHTTFQVGGNESRVVRMANGLMPDATYGYLLLYGRAGYTRLL